MSTSKPEKRSRRDSRYASAWSDWTWSPQYKCEARYRLNAAGEYEYDYRQVVASSTVDYNTPRNREADPPASVLSKPFQPSDASPPGHFRYDDGGVAGITQGMESADLNYPQGSQDKGKAKASYNAPSNYAKGVGVARIPSSATTRVFTRNPNVKSESLDKRFKVHKSHEFSFGRIFKVLWSEPNGTGGTEITEKVPAALGENAHHKVRRFLIVDPRKGHCICLPILTYGGKGCLKPGAHPEDHAIIYTSKEGATLFENERIYRPPIRVEPIDPSHKLDPASRLNYAKLYTVEHNVKVFFIGQVVRRSEQQIVTDYNDIHRPLPDRKYESDARDSDEIFKFSQGQDPVYPTQAPPSTVSSWGQNASRSGPPYTSAYPGSSMTATSMNRSESYSRSFQPDPSMAPAMDRSGGSYAGSYKKDPYLDMSANRARGAYDVSHSGTYQPDPPPQSSTDRGRDAYGRSSYQQDSVSSPNFDSRLQYTESHKSITQYPSSMETARSSYSDPYQQDSRYDSNTAQRPSYTEPGRSYREDAPSTLSTRRPTYTTASDSLAIDNAIEPPIVSSTLPRGSSYTSREYQGSISGAPSSYSTAGPVYTSPRQRKADVYHDDDKYADTGSRRSAAGDRREDDYDDDYKSVDSKGRRKDYQR